MTTIVCISDNGGMLFNKRRQSKDKELVKDLVRLVEEKDGILFVSEYSERLFSESEGSVISVSNPPESASEGDFAFVEAGGLSEYKSKINTLILYKWNRDYPADVFLDLTPQDEGMTLVETTDFEGSSHERITREIWQR